MHLIGFENCNFFQLLKGELSLRSFREGTPSQTPAFKIFKDKCTDKGIKTGKVGGSSDMIMYPIVYPGGGFFHQNRTWMCLPDLENLTISIPIFCQISHPSVYHFRKKSTQFGSNWVLFTIICPKYTQFM